MPAQGCHDRRGNCSLPITIATPSLKSENLRFSVTPAVTDAVLHPATKAVVCALTSALTKVALTVDSLDTSLDTIALETCDFGGTRGVTTPWVTIISLATLLASSALKTSFSVRTSLRTFACALRETIAKWSFQLIINVSHSGAYEFAVRTVQEICFSALTRALTDVPLSKLFLRTSLVAFPWQHQFRPYQTS